MEGDLAERVQVEEEGAEARAERVQVEGEVRQAGASVERRPVEEEERVQIEEGREPGESVYG
jgi:hypothetical protein